ncbi:MAG: exodeoxyribonuclease VII small subunit [Cyclobacteriaceae bacterium]|nr:exodeoxyribonuclease VII small subunit [Cyclobacteriaceae bacterium]
MAKEKFNYSKALEEIERIVSQIENGEVDIDELSEMVKRAATLIRQCKGKLKETNQELDSIIGTLEE